MSTNKDRTNTSKSAGFSGFIILQIVLLSVAAAATSHRVKQIDATQELPEPQRLPFAVTPTYDYPAVVSDEQLREVLVKLKPRLKGPNPKINHVDHALRMWGVDAVFQDDESFSGREMRDLLTDHRKLSIHWGEQVDPLLIPTRLGVKVRVKEGAATSSHVDHTLAGLAEVGTPIDFPIHTDRGRTSVARMLRYSLQDFKLNQREYEWSTLAYAMYLAPTKEWRSSEGQLVTFDVLASRTMRQPYRHGVCYGNHRLFTLAVLLRIDEQHDIISEESRAEIIGFLQEATIRLTRSQHVEGYWDRDWSGDPPPPGSASTRDPITSRILATGHALEWWAIAPTETHPPRESLVRAGQWLARTITEMDDKTVKDNFTYLTHAGRALALWRGRLPAEVLPLEFPDRAPAPGLDLNLLQVEPDEDNQGIEKSAVTEPIAKPATEAKE